MKRKIMGLFLAAVLTVSAFLISARSITYASSETVEINEQNFPDETLRNAVKKKDNGDGKLTQEEISNIKEIGDSPSFTLNNLTGIQYLTAIEELYFKCGENLKTIDLSHNTELNSISISGGKSISLNLNNCEKLKQLRLFDNGLKELDVSNNKKLSSLQVVRCPLEKLDLGNNKALTELNISCESMSNLDVTKNTNLESLSVALDVETIDVSKNVKLKSLDVSQCYNLTSLDTSKLVNLTELEMRETALSAIDLSKNVNLTYLSTTETKIRQLDISNNPGLIKIYKEGIYSKENTFECYYTEEKAGFTDGMIRCDIGTKIITEAESEDNKEDKKEDKKDTTPKYSNEWVNGKWYDADGSQTYKGTMSWKSNVTGWWIEDTSGWYPASQWQKIDGVWYYFKPDGYMASNEYYNGYWFNKDGSWDEKYFLSWKQNSTGWWVEDKSGWWPASSWLKIDGYWYYFDASVYMVTSQYVDGWWISADGVCY